MDELNLINMAFSAGAGLLGVGVGIGLFKSTIQHMQEELKVVQKKQQRLRGEDNAGIPVFMTKTSCESLRNQCGMLTDGKFVNVSKDILKHTKAIKSFENFARWWMQENGLKIDEINRILDIE